MLTTRRCPAHLPLIPTTPLDLDFSHRSPSLCSAASSSSVGASLYPPSGSSTRLQDIQAESPHLRRKASRPLPSIPSTTTPTSAGIGPSPCSANSAARSSLRPLPRPPLQERTASSPLLQVPRCTTPLRPLPIPKKSSGSLRATPISPAITSSSITPSQAQCRQVVQKPNRHPFPSLSLRIDAPGRSITEIVLESPIGPISPLVFNRPISLFPGTTEEDEGHGQDEFDDEDTVDEEDDGDEESVASEDAMMAQEAQVAKRLSELGFVEMEDSRRSSYSDSSESSYGSRLSTSEPSTRPTTSMSMFSATLMPPPRWDSYRHKFNMPIPRGKPGSESVATKCTAEQDVIRVELVTAAAPATGKNRRTSRASRLWVREKKGKRWVENDYLEVMNLLRKL
ncbi:hypothetical protein BDY19DRAFT_39503 [Irpex rosettiformis]|uniref:Uncharacterized protein n=1 Tax=Irpex rosettiformis TaxID=378272 RepID=A0ACB8ULM8_9APHY|nr:hypothetical protein BDY19DRAFT_39503 [Irpex rosettiformis]